MRKTGTVIILVISSQKHYLLLKDGWLNIMYCLIASGKSMKIYNQTSTSKKYIGGILIGFLIAPAIFLFIQGFIFYGIILIIIYLAFETSRTGVDFNFDDSKFTGFREVLFFIKIRKEESIDLNTFSYYRVELQNNSSTMSANFVQSSTVSQEHYTLELFNQDKGEFLQIVKSDVDQIQPLLIKLEERKIVSKN